MELMVVVAVVGLLAAVAFPSYLRSREISDATVKIAEARDIAKLCAVGMKSLIAMDVEDPTGAAIRCDGTASRAVLSRLWTANISGHKCLNDMAIASDTGVWFLVYSSGDIRCFFYAGVP
jgi:type II secretory pathway pseudopilin PulG